MNNKKIERMKRREKWKKMSEPNEERKGISHSEDKKSRKEQTNDIFSNILLFPFLLPVHFLLSFIPSISFFYTPDLYYLH